MQQPSKYAVALAPLGALAAFFPAFGQQNLGTLDITGKVVLSRLVNRPTEGLELHMLNPGAYFVRWHGSTAPITQKLIIR